MAERRVHRKPLRVGSRAILQDARQAMGNDLMNALVELITNADDSYTRLNVEGIAEIRVEIDKRRRIIRIDDDAEGMTAEQLEERLGGLGERTSGIVDNDQVRGFFGRGAKDVAALGDVTWVSSRGGLQSQLTITLSADEDDAVEIAEPIEDKSGRDGTTVQVQLRDGVAIPRREHLLKLLSRHFALVPMLSDPMRRLVVTAGGRTTTVARENPRGKLWLDAVPFRLPGYTDESINVTLLESPVPLDDAESGRLGLPQYWRHSLLVTSGRAAYEFWPGGAYAKPPDSTYFRRLFGRVEVPLINKLLIEADVFSGGEEIVTRNRHGLARGAGYRFTAALDEALEGALKPHIERLREDALQSNADHTTRETRRMLDRLASVLNEYVREETEPETPGAGAEPRTDLAGLRVIPPSRHVEPFRPAHLYVRYTPTSEEAGEPVVSLTIADDSGTPSVESLPLVKRGGYYSATYRMDGREAGAVVELTAELDGEGAEALVLWEERLRPQVDGLRFEREGYTMRPGASRIVRLLAPVNVHDLVPVVGFVGQPGLFLEKLSRSFEWDDERECCVFVVRVGGDQEDLEGTIRGEMSGVECFTEVRTRLPGLAGMRIDLSEKYAEATERAWYDESRNTLVVNAKHPDVGAYLGPIEEGRPGQESLPFRTMLREMVCHAVVSYTLQASQVGLRETSETLGQYEREFEKLIERTRGIVVGDADWV